MISFATQFGHEPTHSAELSSLGGSAICQTTPVSPDVTPTLSDDEREAAIQRAGKFIESSMAEWDESGCFAARGRAERARMLMEALIRGRSPERVAQMERERGLL